MTKPSYKKKAFKETWIWPIRILKRKKITKTSNYKVCRMNEICGSIDMSRRTKNTLNIANNCSKCRKHLVMSSLLWKTKKSGTFNWLNRTRSCLIKTRNYSINWTISSSKLKTLKVSLIYSKWLANSLSRPEMRR